VSKFDQEYQLRGGRCFWCQRLIPPDLMTREHVYCRRNQQRRIHGAAWVLACERCNQARNGLTIGSTRFNKWLRRVMRGDIRPYFRYSLPIGLGGLSIQTKAGDALNMPGEVKSPGHAS